jgi:phage replication-related protein YjqB (UPF0714/DUF867 family)
MADRYRTFDELARSEVAGVDYRVYKRDAGRTLILAPHGGGIEPGTSELAVAIAGKDHSLYLFEGLKRVRDVDLHITSTHFDEPECLIAIQRCDTVLAIHGEAGDTAVVHIGGRDITGGRRIEAELKNAGFNARRCEQPDLAGESERNICNRGRSGEGIQLEITAGLRGRFFRGITPRADRNDTTQTFARFVSAVQAGLRDPT